MKIVYPIHSHGALMVLIPGGTGVGSEAQRGLEVTKNFFQQREWNVEIFLAAGQPGRDGSFSLAAAACELQTFIADRLVRHASSRLCLFGTCSGGTMAVFCASRLPEVTDVMLFETLPRYSPCDIKGFEPRAIAAGVTLDPDWATKYIHTVDFAPDFKGRVLLMTGDGSTPPVVTDSDARTLEKSFSAAKCICSFVIRTAKHSATREHATPAFQTILNHATQFPHHE